MVFGKIDDPDCKPLNFIEAAKLAGIKPDVMRRWLDRAEVRALLLKERKAFRAAICAGNEAALQRVRDKSANGMVTVAAVRALEQIDDDDPHRCSAGDSTPFMTIKIVTPPAAAPASAVVEHEPIEPENRDPHDPCRELAPARFRDPTRGDL
jgi:hypothetical protein